jgi:acetylornithine/succinyldiaminopimelate/putrescine aminotransferase
VQCGIYRTGTPFAFQQLGVVPDIVAMAKGIAGGFPMGACAARDAVAEVFQPGIHGSTFGGSNLAVAAARATLDAIVEEGVPTNVMEVGAYFKEQLEAIPQAKEVRGMGLMLAIDDFSMGQTSIRYLQDNLFDLIKLDGALVRGLETNANCKEIISSITELAENLKLQVLAEYVETEDQKNLLHEIGCDHYQGYLFSPAVPLKAEANK